VTTIELPLASARIREGKGAKTLSALGETEGELVDEAGAWADAAAARAMQSRRPRAGPWCAHTVLFLVMIAIISERARAFHIAKN
jgi:hypothetical protein